MTRIKDTSDRDGFAQFSTLRVLELIQMFRISGSVQFQACAYTLDNGAYRHLPTDGDGLSIG